MRESRELVSHSLLVNNANFGLLSALQDIETGQRGYLITGDTAYLQPYDKAVRNVRPLIKRLAALVDDNAAQSARVRAVILLADRKMAETARTIEVRKAAGFDDSRALVIQDDGKNVMDELRARINEMRSMEQSLLSQRMDAMRQADRNIAFVALTGILLALMARLWATIVRIRMRRRKRAVAISASADDA